MSGERIVILDDEADMAASLARVLTKAGYECLVTSDPTEGLRMLGSERPDLLLTDLRMPAMDGMEVLAQAREIDPRLPVIVLTGHASIESAVAAVKAGAFDFLSKTFSNDQLKLTVERALTKRRLELENFHLRDQLRSTLG